MVKEKSKFDLLMDHPFFMNDLPDNIEDNVPLQALQSLLYEGTPNEIAENFKEKGNEAYKEKRLQDALISYSKGLAEDLTGFVDLKKTLLSNRSMAHLALKNYRSAVKDCIDVLKIDPTSEKALYRAAVALKELEKYEESMVFVNEGLRNHPSNSMFQDLSSQIGKLAKQKEAKEKEKLDRLAQQEKLYRIIKEKGITLCSKDEVPASPIPPCENLPKMNWNEDGTLSWPVFLLYPELGQADFIEKFNETDTFIDHLLQILPLPWESKNSYASVADIDIFFEYWKDKECTKKGVVSVNSWSKLLETLQHQKMKVYHDGIPIFLILSKCESEQFLKLYE